MLVKPNKTELIGTIRALRAEPDGQGAEVDLEVVENASANPDADFLRPQPGSIIKAYYARPEQIPVGQTVRADLSVSGGPSGQRTILRSFRPR